MTIKPKTTDQAPTEARQDMRGARITADIPAPAVADMLIAMYGEVKANNIVRLVTEKISSRTAKSVIDMKADRAEIKPKSH